MSDLLDPIAREVEALRARQYDARLENEVMRRVLSDGVYRAGVVVWYSMQSGKMKGAGIYTLPCAPHKLGWRGDVATMIEIPLKERTEKAIIAAATSARLVLKQRLKTDSKYAQIMAMLHEQFVKGPEKPEVEIVEEKAWREIMKKTG